MRLNRRQRRMFFSEARRDDRMSVRVHMAGFAMARLAVAPVMGWPGDKIVDHIEYAIPEKAEPAERKGEIRLWFNNATYGLFLSAEMQAIAKAFGVDTDCRLLEHSELLGLFDRFRNAGCDLKTWAIARYLIAFGGTVAEAKFRDLDVWDVIDEQIAQGEDFPVLVRDLALLKRKYVSETMLRLSASYLRYIFNQPNVWRTTLTLAKALRLGEATPGTEVMAIIGENLKEIKLHDFDELPQARIRRDPTSNSVATCFLTDLDDWRFSSVSGGRQIRTEREFIYAKIWCSELIDGSVGHSCAHGDGPHEILVCVLPRDNPDNWDVITKKAAWALHHAA